MKPTIRNMVSVCTNAFFLVRYSVFGKCSDPLTFPAFVTLQTYSKMEKKTNSLLNLQMIFHNDKAKTDF